MKSKLLTRNIGVDPINSIQHWPKYYFILNLKIDYKNISKVQFLSNPFCKKKSKSILGFRKDLISF
jgi:hypothetical protein